MKDMNPIWLALILCFSTVVGNAQDKNLHDFIIKSGTVVDGTGNPGFIADIGIRGDRIAEIGDISDKRGKRVIDARGLIVSPGFIDVHTHTDQGLDSHPEARNYLLQGVTTVVGGNCGGSRFPLDLFFRRIQARGIALNFATFAGHNTIRREVMGDDNRKPTPEELKRMKDLVEQEMLTGAIGLSTGLEYIPGRFSETEEIIALAREIRPFNGIYATHLRDQGEHIRDAVEEALRIGGEAGVKVQISHIKLKVEKYWGKRDMITGPIERARKQGVEVYMDEYPYTAGSTGFTSSFPEWAVTGGHEAFVKQLDDAEQYRKIKDHIIDFRFRSARGIDKAEMITITRNRNHPEYEGNHLAEILDMMGQRNTTSNAADLFIQLEKEDRPGAIFFQADEKDVVALMQEDYCMVGSDGGIAIFEQGVTHPRTYGTFPKVIAKYVRDENHLTLPDAIRKMTSLPAHAMGFAHRGVLRPGMFADMTIFNLDRIRDKATYQEPHQYPEGIHFVIVNGNVAVQDGEIVNKDSGRIIYGSGKKD